jgi:hypothetical protein
VTATNHALTGALIGLVAANPIVAVPVSFLSHYVLDVIPHFGKSDDPDFIKTKFFRNYLMIDASLCILLVLVLAAAQPQYWLLASVCAFFATSPDLALIPRFVAAKKNKPYRPGAYNHFAARIQRYEKPEGGLVEFAWACMAIALLVGFF